MWGADPGGVAGAAAVKADVVDLAVLQFKADPARTDAAGLIGELHDYASLSFGLFFFLKMTNLLNR